MFLQFYKLREQPFGVTPDPRFVYLSKTHELALGSLLYGIENSLGFAMLIGEPGVGKTTLLFRVLETYRGRAATAFVFETQCGSAGLLRYLLNELGAHTEESRLDALHERFREVVMNATNRDRRVIIVIDEAQNLSSSLLETVRLLSNVETRRTKLVHIILAGQPGLADELSRPEMAHLEQRLAVASWLRPLSPEETGNYVDRRLRVAGWTGDALFTASSLKVVTVHSGGIPRKINRICFRSLEMGCALGKTRIDSETVEQAVSYPGTACLDPREASSLSERLAQERLHVERWLSLRQQTPSRSTATAAGIQKGRSSRYPLVPAGQSNSSISEVRQMQETDHVPALKFPIRGNLLKRWSEYFRAAFGSLAVIGILACSAALRGQGGPEAPTETLPVAGNRLPEAREKAVSDKPRFAERTPRYQVRPGDVIEILFSPAAEFNQTLAVQPDGFVTLREVGDFYVQGKTLPELTDALNLRYQTILSEPVITVVLKDFEQPHFIVGGQVARPGKYELRGDTMITEAVAIAGGVTERGKNTQVLLFRRVSDDWVEVKELDLKAIYKGRVREDIQLRPGDMLFVPQNRISKIKPYLPTWTLGGYLGGGSIF